MIQEAKGHLVLWKQKRKSKQEKFNIFFSNIIIIVDQYLITILNKRGAVKWLKLKNQWKNELEFYRSNTELSKGLIKNCNIHIIFNTYQ